jgi:hypothetical protein
MTAWPCLRLNAIFLAHFYCVARNGYLKIFFGKQEEGQIVFFFFARMHVENRFFVHCVVFVLLSLLPLQPREDTQPVNFWDVHGLLFSVALLLQPQITLLFFTAVPWSVAFVLCALLFPEVTAISLFFVRGYHYDNYLLLLGYIPLAFSRYFKFDDPSPPQAPYATRNEDGTVSFNVAPEIGNLVVHLAQNLRTVCMSFL